MADITTTHNANNNTTRARGSRVDRSALEMPERITRLKDELLSAQTEFCFERARIVTESYRRTEGCHPAIRRARAIAKVFDEMPIFIRRGELLVGQRAASLAGRAVYPEFHLNGLTESTTPRDIWEYWHGRTMGDRTRACHPEALRVAEAESAAGYCTGASTGYGHMIVDYEKALHVGFEGIIEEAESGLASALAEEDSEGVAFLESVITVSRGLIRWAHRYAELAESAAAGQLGASPAHDGAAREGDAGDGAGGGGATAYGAARDVEPLTPGRRAELLEIARVCRKVPAQPAGTFHEALQSLWFVHIALHIEQFGWSISAGRFDQYMYPFYAKDQADGTLSREQGWELLLSLWVKFMENVGTRVKQTVFQNLTIGGADADGRDQSNQLSHLCLDATAVLGFNQPALSVRWHPEIDGEFWRHCHRVIALGTGMPAIFNDEIIIPALVSHGVRAEDAQGYGIVGCVEASVPGKEQGVTAGGHLNVAKALELALNEGRSMVSGQQLGPRTPPVESMDDFNQLWDAYETQVRYLSSLDILASVLAGEEQKRSGYYPLESALLSDCIEQRRDLVFGATRYNLPGVAIYGPSNTYDALHAIRRLVFEQGKIDIADLRQALLSDFQGYEALRLQLFNHDERFGNDIAAVDRLASEVNAVHGRFFWDHTDGRGGRFTCGVWPVEAHVNAGRKTAAGADGRRSGTPLVDGVGACQGADRQGPTALLSSVSRLDNQENWTAGNTFNIKFSRSSVSGDEGVARLSALAESFLRLGGQQIQINVVDAETLRCAQERPDEYENLLVRVAGFSAYFTTLSRATQDEIISRTEQTIAL